MTMNMIMGRNTKVKTERKQKRRKVRKGNSNILHFQGSNIRAKRPPCGAAERLVYLYGEKGVLRVGDGWGAFGAREGSFYQRIPMA